MGFSAYIRSRKVTNKIRWTIDNLLPPLVSDSYWFNWIVARIFYGRFHFDLDFKEKALAMSTEELNSYFVNLGKCEPYREGDTTTNQMNYLVHFVVGKKILEVGCGNGALALQLADRGFEIMACDLKSSWITPLNLESSKKFQNLRFMVSNALSLPFNNNSFDTVITSHTLEHIPNLQTCLDEIKRVVKHRILIVVPCQKYKRYTIDTHVHFFPTESILRWSLKLPPSAICKRVDGDWTIAWDLIEANLTQS